MEIFIAPVQHGAVPGRRGFTAQRWSGRKDCIVPCAALWGVAAHRRAQQRLIHLLLSCDQFIIIYIVLIVLRILQKLFSKFSLIKATIPELPPVGAVVRSARGGGVDSTVLLFPWEWKHDVLQPELIC